MSDDDGQGAVYELTVAGSLGPVLRAALPAAAVTDLVTTTVRAPLASEAELEDLLGLLDAAGVEVQAVFRLSAP